MQSRRSDPRKPVEIANQQSERRYTGSDMTVDVLIFLARSVQSSLPVTMRKRDFVLSKAERAGTESLGIFFCQALSNVRWIIRIGQAGFACTKGVMSRRSESRADATRKASMGRLSGVADQKCRKQSE